MSNLPISQNQSVSNTRTYDNKALQAALVLALDRLRVDPFPLDAMIEDIRLCYPDVKTSDITTAIRKGSSGEYGKTFRFSFQEVSIWIMEYRKEHISGRGQGGFSMEEYMNGQ